VPVLVKKEVKDLKMRSQREILKRNEMSEMYMKIPMQDKENVEEVVPLKISHYLKIKSKIDLLLIRISRR